MQHIGVHHAPYAHAVALLLRGIPIGYVWRPDHTTDLLPKFRWATRGRE